MYSLVWLCYAACSNGVFAGHDRVFLYNRLGAYLVLHQGGSRILHDCLYICFGLVVGYGSTVSRMMNGIA